MFVSKPSFQVMENQWVAWALSRISDQCPDPKPYIGSDDAVERQLAKWVQTVRRQKKRNTLPKDQEEAISRLPGWSWGKNNDEEFSRKVERWSNWYRKTGGSPPRNTSNASVEEKKLALWASRYRNCYRKGKLPEHYYPILNQLQGWSWETRSAKQSSCTKKQKSKGTMINKWEDFVTLNGHKPSKDENKPLYLWRKNVIKKYLSGALKEEQIERFSELPHWDWEDQTPVDQNILWCRKWSTWVKLNRKYIPQATSPNPRERELGEWAQYFEQMIRSGQVSDDLLKEMVKISYFKEHFFDRV